MGSLFSKADAGPPRQRGIIRRRGAGDDLGPAPKRPRVQPAPKPARSLRRKKRKVALFVAYDGSRYHGMQVNKGVATIEGEVLAALVRCSLIPDDSRDTQTSIQWCRAARTDKGVSAACQCLSLRLACELSGQLDESIIDGLNEELPRDIAVIAILRTTASFSSRVDCHRRTYEYVFPVRVLGGANGVERREDGRDGDARIARLNELLGQYVGTHCFANFTEGLESSDEASKRYMIRVAASEPFLAPDGATYLTAVVLRGQSFVIYQIRKMVGLALAVFSGAAPPEAIQVVSAPCRPKVFATRGGRLCDAPAGTDRVTRRGQGALSSRAFSDADRTRPGAASRRGGILVVQQAGGERSGLSGHR
jgi:tRNA pseudouridine38-40 synthase